MKIIPAIDIIDGKCVRLSRGDYATRVVYYDDPLEVAKKFEANGIRYLHLVDLDGAKSNRIINYKVLARIAQHTSLKIDFGGGLKSSKDVKIAFESGANQITGGSVAVKNEEIFKAWIEEYGPDKIILGADCTNRKIATNGWTQGSDIEVIEFIRSYEQLGIKDVISTDIEKDGMLKGPSLDLYKDILANTSINLIASGGVANIHDLIKLREIGCSGAIVGKAIYEGTITFNQLRELC